ncbi:hypothetical protein pipiens_012745 [Culex pipiens pipiens]|uniref:Uncharacterized protein n=1 Tax=Culex pipiens pipiens TaxID=38569 RepID=A0ABD1D140_CULPP
MKENPMIDVFDVSSDFNPDMILSNVFLDPSLDFMTSIDDADIMAQDFLHFATASGSGSAMFYPTEQSQHKICSRWSNSKCSNKFKCLNSSRCNCSSSSSLRLFRRKSVLWNR